MKNKFINIKVEIVTAADVMSWLITFPGHSNTGSSLFSCANIINVIKDIVDSVLVGVNVNSCLTSEELMVDFVCSKSIDASILQELVQCFYTDFYALFESQYEYVYIDFIKDNVVHKDLERVEEVKLLAENAKLQEDVDIVFISYAISLIHVTQDSSGVNVELQIPGRFHGDKNNFTKIRCEITNFLKENGILYGHTGRCYSVTPDASNIKAKWENLRYADTSFQLGSHDELEVRLRDAIRIMLEENFCSGVIKHKTSSRLRYCS